MLNFRFRALSRAFIYQFSANRSGLGLKMGKFRQISTGLWPLMYVKISLFWALSLSLHICAFIDKFSSNLYWSSYEELRSGYMGLDLLKACKSFWA